MPSNLSAAEQQRLLTSTAAVPPFPDLPESVFRAIGRLDPNAEREFRQWQNEVRLGWNLMRTRVQANTAQ